MVRREEGKKLPFLPRGPCARKSASFLIPLTTRLYRGSFLFFMHAQAACALLPQSCHQLNSSLSAKCGTNSEAKALRYETGQIPHKLKEEKKMQYLEMTG
jgi:hypothetical protein